MELYRSILLKLGQLPTSSLAEVNAFLSGLVEKKEHTQKGRYKTQLVHLAGAWKDWDEQEFNAFLDNTLQTRADMFVDREASL